ncbi:MAG: peptidylprolyl isomerase [Planctomycetota bacterium]|nr:peptidylprolyl isomerase [Planctomycetota bacterium]
MLVSVLLSLSCVAALPQQDVASQVLATFDGGQIEAERFDRHLGADARHQQSGAEALVHILRLQIVSIEAANLGLVATDKEIDERIAIATEQIEAAGMSLENLLAGKELEMSDLRKLIGSSILHEQLVRHDLSLSIFAEVSSQQLEEWSNNKLNELLELSKQAPPGMALDAPPFRVSEQELGRVMRRTMSKEELQDRLEQMVLTVALPKWAADNKMVLSDDILNDEIEWRRKRVNENPAYGGATYEGLLEAKGMTVESVRQSDELRVAGYLRLLSEQVMPDSFFENLSEELTQRYDNEHGETRNVGWILLRADDEKESPLDLNFDEAKEELLALRDRIKTTEDFNDLAYDYSEDDRTRRRGGMLGWIHHYEKGVTTALAKAAFSMEGTGIYGPIKIVDENPFQPLSGMALILVKDILPRPSEEEFQDAIRRGTHRDLRQSFLEGITLKSVFKPSN